MSANEGVFALYKGDTFIDIGTAKELAKKMNVQPKFIKYLSTPANLKRIEERKKYNSLITVKLGRVSDNYGI